MIPGNWNKQDAFYTLQKKLRGRIDADRKLARYTSYKTGGTVDLFVQPADIDDLCVLLQFLRETKIPFFVIGKGTNLLIHDKGFRGAVIYLAKSFNTLSIQDTHVYVESGYLLWDFLMNLADKGLGGLERLIGIPGTVGGAIYMNAGAFGAEIFDRIESVDVVTTAGEVKRMSKQEIPYGYRHGLTDRNKIIVAAHLQLSREAPGFLHSTMNEIWQRRKQKQPLSYPSAGSVFKRPAGGFAGALIERAGLKGLQIGGAVVSTKHANFILNKYHASAQDIYDLIQKIRKIVNEKYDVWLELENELIGWDENSK